MINNQEQRKGGAAVIRLDHSYQLTREPNLKCTLDDDSSLDSSVASGIRNSLHSTYDFSDLELQDADDYFDGYDSFDENEDDEPLPSWRLDPNVSGSDWIMTIRSSADGSETNYHVHKRVLAKGFNRSEYFVSMFGLLTDKSEQASSTTIVHGNALHLIPDMLDYLYSGDGVLNVGTETAVPLLHLSQFFGIRSLATDLLGFIYDDICLETVPLYFAAAAAFEDVQTLKLCATVCAEEINEIQPFSPLFKDMHASCFLDIISAPQIIDRQNQSSHLSTLVASYCWIHKDKITQAAFEELSLEEYLPVVSAEAARTLLLLEAQLVPGSQAGSYSLTCLQQRCLRALQKATFARAEPDLQSPTLPTTRILVKQ